MLQPTETLALPVMRKDCAALGSKEYKQPPVAGLGPDASAEPTDKLHNTHRKAAARVERRNGKECLVRLGKCRCINKRVSGSSSIHNIAPSPKR